MNYYYYGTLNLLSKEYVDKSNYCTLLRVLYNQKRYKTHAAYTPNLFAYTFVHNNIIVANTE